MKYSLFSFFLIVFSLSAKEVDCIPDYLNAPFDKVSLYKEGRGNSYNLKVIYDERVIYQDNVLYSFLRRGQTSYYKNKDQTVEIKTKRLYVNSVTPSYINIKGVTDGWIRGVCKLYPED